MNPQPASGVSPRFLGWKKERLESERKDYLGIPGHGVILQHLRLAAVAP